MYFNYFQIKVLKIFPNLAKISPSSHFQFVQNLFWLPSSFPPNFPPAQEIHNFLQKAFVPRIRRSTSGFVLRLRSAGSWIAFTQAAQDQNASLPKLNCKLHSWEPWEEACGWFEPCIRFEFSLNVSSQVHRPSNTTLLMAETVTSRCFYQSPFLSKGTQPVCHRTLTHNHILIYTAVTASHQLIDSYSTKASSVFLPDDKSMFGRKTFLECWSQSQNKTVWTDL